MKWLLLLSFLFLIVQGSSVIDEIDEEKLYRSIATPNVHIRDNYDYEVELEERRKIVKEFQDNFHGLEIVTANKIICVMCAYEICSGCIVDSRTPCAICMNSIYVEGEHLCAGCN